MDCRAAYPPHNASHPVTLSPGQLLARDDNKKAAGGLALLPSRQRRFAKPQAAQSLFATAGRFAAEPAVEQALQQAGPFGTAVARGTVAGRATEEVAAEILEQSLPMIARIAASATAS